MWKRWDTPQNFFLAFTDKLEKQIIIKKNCWSGSIKNKIILIFTKLHLLKKIKKNTCRYHYQNLNNMIYSVWDIVQNILKLAMKQKWKKKKKKKNAYISTINKDHMIYGSWNIRCDRQKFLSFWTIFALSAPWQPRKSKF